MTAGSAATPVSPSPTKRLVQLVPALALTAMFVALIPAEGGFPTRVWYPAALFLLGLVVVLALAQGRLPLPVAKSAIVAVAAFTAFTIWSFLSIAWADVQALAWEGANRTLLYLLAFTLLAALPLTTRAAMTVLSVFAIGTAFVGVLELTLGLGDPGSVFLGGRFAVPTDYANANAAVFLVALWPALVLTTEKTLPAPLRGLLLGSAGVLAELALVCQSRGSAVAAGVTALVIVALAPDRIRLIAAIGLVGAAVALAAPSLLDATNEVVAGGGDLSAVIRRLLEALLVTFAVLTVGGFVLAHLDRKIGEGTRRLRLVVLGAAAALAICVVAAGVATGNSPRAIVAGARDDVEAELRTSRYGSSGSQSRRGEHWRVALGEFRQRPVEGMGVDNFGVAYIRERRDDVEEPLYPHSLPVRIVSQTGLVGTTLFAVFLVSALIAAFSRRTVSRANRIAVVAAVAPFVYWFIHGAADWLWEFPGLSLPALGFLGLAGAIGREREDLGPPWTGRKTARLGLVAAGAAGVLAVCSVTTSWLSARELEAGFATWRSSPAASDAHFARARRLNPLTDAPDVAAGVVAGRRGRLAEMREAFERALARNPNNWYSHLELALVDAIEGNRAEALAHLHDARVLNPQEAALIDVERRVRGGERVPIREIDSIFRERVGSLVR